MNKKKTDNNININAGYNNKFIIKAEPEHILCKYNRQQQCLYSSDGNIDIPTGEMGSHQQV
jgi:hypothetical protein